MKAFLLGLLLIGASVHAHESNRELQLKAANDELTMRLAEVLAENEQLRASAAELVNSVRSSGSTKPIATGCFEESHDRFLDRFILTKKALYRFVLINPLLEERGASCTLADLEFIERDLIPQMSRDSDQTRTKELVAYLKSRF